MNTDWTELENRLRSRSGAQAHDELLARVMRAVTAELSHPRPRWNTAHWAAVAAAAVLLFNFSMVSTSRDLFSFHRAHSLEQITDELAAIGQIEAQQERMLK